MTHLSPGVVLFFNYLKTSQFLELLSISNHYQKKQMTETAADNPSMNQAIDL